MKDHFEQCNVLVTGKCTCPNEQTVRDAYWNGYRQGRDDTIARMQEIVRERGE